MASEIASKAKFNLIRYSQCWEDADILFKGLNINPEDTCLSIASAGDNSFALLVGNPKKVIAIDLSQAQLYCVELRAECYKHLTHQEFLELLGSYPSSNRMCLYEKVRMHLSPGCQNFWDSKTSLVAKYGAAGTGKFERYFRLFRDYFLPLIHSKQIIEQTLASKTKEEQTIFYNSKWNNFRWRLLTKLFFSRTVMGLMGRDPSFFQYVESSMYEHVSGRVKHALIELETSNNPYLGWIVTGHHAKEALPMSLRPENFEIIRRNIDRFEWQLCSFEDAISLCQANNLEVTKYNLSDIFEYMSEENYVKVLKQIIATSDKGTRIAYWNMLVPRARPQSLANRIKKLDDLSAELFRQDKAFFYSAFHIEELL